ncbi:hypothetical protein [Streptomyces rubiginosohelvolus]|uniref:hypothetical protein n=1 Tax=Streptomyces rubiginosohelvolus TaxID=67362 RepID=UPI0036575195
MTGPEHYRKAEDILDDLRRASASIVQQPRPETVTQMLAEAQVHATLALAAATALPPGVNSPARSAWASVAAEKQPDYEVRDSFA